MPLNANFSFALESLVKVIAKETNLLLEAGFNVQLLSSKLKMIQLYIQQSSSRHDSDIEAIKQIREAAHYAEDLISKYALKVARYKRRSKWGKFRHSVGHGKMIHNASNKIEDLKKIIDQIFENKGKFKSNGGANEGEDAGTTLNLDVNPRNFINFTADIDKIRDMLTEEEPRRRVISILGMGGSGKTAFAMKLYNLFREINHFECLVLVTLKQGTDVDDILRQIIWNLSEQREGIQELGLIRAQLKKKEKERNLSQQLQELDYEKLKKILLQHLQEKRYLVVIDNVWESQLWDPLLKAFPDNLKGSRILITSRRKGVANITNSSIHFLSELGIPHGRQLFCNVVFDSDACPPNFVHLEDPKNKVVEISHGLPIVTVVLGNLLAVRERMEQTWTRFIGNGNSYPAEGRMQWRDKLALSYDQIEINLKFCYFYFGSFPANYEIPVTQLIQLWIAEEFIPQNSHPTLEGAAEEYLNELIERLLIQPTSWRLDGGIKTCRIHNVLRDLCLYESKKEDFLEVLHDGSDLSSYSSRPRRLSLHRSTPDFLDYSSKSSSSSAGCNTSSVRSFLCFDKDGNTIHRNNLEWLCESIRMVRVLKLGDGQVQSIPKRIRKLYLLKYLKLKGAELTVLPDSICELLNLVTLDLRGSSVNRLPNGIWELQNLRHLYISQPTKLPGPSDNSKIFPSLQIFSCLALDQDTVNLITGSKFPLLRKLGLYKQHDQDGIPHNVFKNIHQNLSHLERLKIKAPSYGLFFFQSLFRELKSLTRITLVECKIDFAVLEKLPNLQYLKVHEGRSTSNPLQCDENSFARLLGFQMTRFPIERWTISAGAMPKLQRLIIKACPNLQALPDELRRLTMLKKVHVHRPCKEELVTIVEQMKTDMGNRCDIELFG